MSDLFWLSDAQMARLEPYSPKSPVSHALMTRVLSVVLILLKLNGLRWLDAPKEYGLHKTLYNRWKPWSDKGIFANMMARLAAEHGEKKTAIIDATYLKAYRTASSLIVNKGGPGRLIGRTNGGMNTNPRNCLMSGIDPHSMKVRIRRE
tara:strand:+ start:15863 stop:16309 length:447 start_codon:yes stop_codon:yes gene_type:complete